MASAINTLCDAIATLLNGGSFSQSFTATRAYTPTFTLAEMSTLRVTVSPDSSQSERADRRGVHYQYDADVILCVQKTVDTSSNTASDAMADLVQELHDYLFANPSTGSAQLLSIAHDSTVSESEYLHESVFQAVLVCTYRQLRSAA